MSTKLLAKAAAPTGRTKMVPGRLPIEIQEVAKLAQVVEPDWRLSEETRRRGRQGVAAAREVLAEAVRRSAA